MVNVNATGAGSQTQFRAAFDKHPASQALAHRTCTLESTVWGLRGSGPYGRYRLHLLPGGAWRNTLLPGVGVLGERSQAAGVHVAAHVDVHRCVGLGELSWQWDPLGSQGRHRRPGERQPGHVSFLLETETRRNTRVSPKRHSHATPFIVRVITDLIRSLVPLPDHIFS
jgi:hypothetical protein